jgi:SAM-dependent methyltransferase
MSDFKEYGNIQSSISYFQSFEFNRNNCVLDIGSHYGTFLNRLYELGYQDVMGIDTNGGTLEKGGEVYQHLRNKLQVYDGRQIPFADGSFDIVSMFDVLEHIPNVHEYLFEVHRVLKPSGFLIFQTPNKYINIAWELSRGRSLDYLFSFHCSLQSIWSLRRNLDKAGFTEIKIVKYKISSEYNKEKTRETLGALGPMLLSIAERLPLLVYPNLWGYCRKSR